MSERLYQFSWDLIGDVDNGRPNLGKETRVEVYRLFQYTMRDVLEQRLGAEEANRVLYDAGFLAGSHFCKQYVGKSKDFPAFLAKVEQALLELGVGILRMEESAPDAGHFVLTVDEDLDCSGLPEMHHTVCTYDEGFIAGIFHYFSDKHFTVKEIDCWCIGGRTCRFEVKPADA